MICNGFSEQSQRHIASGSGTAISKLKRFQLTCQEQQKAHLQTCQILHDRIQAGINAIGRNVHLRESFRYANAAMALQHSWKASPEDGPLRWRPFQLGFILLAAESSCDPESENREILDLLWFPTGGGKTEAYLAIIAMVGWYRRLTCKDPDEGSGNAAVMRYTLRLLTAQQFERASSMILASELIRRGAIFPRVGKKEKLARQSFLSASG
ncbi:hypothetical protein ACFS07_10850 [Undibacterium arcticum]